MENSSVFKTLGVGTFGEGEGSPTAERLFACSPGHNADFALEQSALLVVRLQAHLASRHRTGWHASLGGTLPERHVQGPGRGCGARDVHRTNACAMTVSSCPAAGWR